MVMTERQKRYRVLDLAGKILASPDNWEDNLNRLLDMLEQEVNSSGVWVAHDVLYTIKEVIGCRLSQPIPWFSDITPSEAALLFGGD